MRTTPAKTLIVALALAAGGCASQPMPAGELAAARSAVAAASQAGPSPELHKAAAKLQLAKRWTDARDYGPARWLAEQAEVDAELAAARAAASEAARSASLAERAAAGFVMTSLQR